MQYINTTFAHGNGPYSRCVEWGIEVNNVREEKSLKRLPIVVPLVYPERQERIIIDEIKTNSGNDFLEKHPDEIWLDVVQGKLLRSLMFNGCSYEENLELLVENYQKIEDEFQRHLDGKRDIRSLCGDNHRVQDMRDCAFQLGFNNRMQTGLPNQFSTSGGAGPFHELLERAISIRNFGINQRTMIQAFPIARRMIENQKIIFLNYPGVFSYDENRVLGCRELYTPPFVHPPSKDNTELPSKGIYLLMTGIDGIRENGIYDAIFDLDLQVYAPHFSIKRLPEDLRKKAILLKPNQINNSNIVAQYSRAGWSSVWLSHLAEKGFITPPYQEKDDPEMLFNERSIDRLGLGVVIRDNPKKSLEKSVELAQRVWNFNSRLLEEYGTLDGIRYSANNVVSFLEKS